MENSLKKRILELTGASDIEHVEKIQSLWSGYGEILRIHLLDSRDKSIVVKHVRLPETSLHPRGWNTGLSHKRKIKSYHVECAFYRDWSKKCSTKARIPLCLDQEISSDDSEFLILLEDLDSRGYSERRSSVNDREMKLCLEWLAIFHASYINSVPDNLWKTGTYWHLETRPDELSVLSETDLPLKDAAAEIDLRLKSSPYQTLVHGDAKLANFCFTPKGTSVAAVDFQYTGGGCGIKDVAYFTGSCFYERDCEKKEEEILDYYFSSLKTALKEMKKEINFDDLEKNWRELYPLAWTDFHRFLKGWSPGHWKINSYSERISRQVIDSLEQESFSEGQL